jgi:large subunit ribosomal protein L19
MNPQQIVEDIVAKQLKPNTSIPDFTVGDTINVSVRIIEGDKERTQVYQGVLIATKGRGVNKTITVRRIVANEGVERVFPLHSPRIATIEVVRRSDARRAKLYYLRDRIGRSRRLRDQRRGLKNVGDEAAATETSTTA